MTELPEFDALRTENAVVVIHSCEASHVAKQLLRRMENVDEIIVSKSGEDGRSPESVMETVLRAAKENKRVVVIFENIADVLNETNVIQFRYQLRVAPKFNVTVTLCLQSLASFPEVHFMRTFAQYIILDPKLYASESDVSFLQKNCLSFCPANQLRALSIIVQNVNCGDHLVACNKPA